MATGQSFSNRRGKKSNERENTVHPGNRVHLSFISTYRKKYERRKKTSPMTYRAKTSQGGTRGCFINQMTSSLLNWPRGSFSCQTRGSLARVRHLTGESRVQLTPEWEVLPRTCRYTFHAEHTHACKHPVHAHGGKSAWAAAAKWTLGGGKWLVALRPLRSRARAPLTHTLTHSQLLGWP